MYKDSYNHRKRYYITLFTSIYVIIFSICAIVIGVNWKYVKFLFTPQEKQITMEQYQFNEIFNKVKCLEELSKQYNEENYQLRAVAYIRSAQYNGGMWDYFIFEDLAEFEAYVQQNQGNSKVSSLKTLGSGYSFVVPKTKEKIDFYHFFATLNGLMINNQEIADITGWGGDLVQLAAAYANTDLLGDDLLNSIKASMNSTSAFGEADRNADMDAINIYSMLKNNNFTFNSVYLNSVVYYATIDKTTQVKNFKQFLGVDNCSQIEIESVLYERLRENSYIQMLADDYGLDYPDLGENEEATKNAEIYKACIKAFVETLKV